MDDVPGVSLEPSDVMHALRVACPSFEPVWLEHLAYWGDDVAGDYNDIAELAHHLVTRLGLGLTSEFPALFTAVEDGFVRGTPEAVNVLAVGLLEDLQTIASHGEGGVHPEQFRPYLGPRTTAAWDEVIEFWVKLGESRGSQGSLSPQIDPSQVKDPQLRRLLQGMYRVEPKSDSTRDT